MQLRGKKLKHFLYRFVHPLTEGSWGSSSSVAFYQKFERFVPTVTHVWNYSHFSSPNPVLAYKKQLQSMMLPSLCLSVVMLLFGKCVFVLLGFLHQIYSFELWIKVQRQFRHIMCSTFSARLLVRKGFHLFTLPYHWDTRNTSSALQNILQFF